MSGFPNIRLLADDLVRLPATTLGASPALASGLGADRLRTSVRSEVARSTSAVAQAILGDFGAAKPVNCVVLWRHNLTPESTWRVELFDGAGQTGATLYDSSPTATYTVTPLDELNWGVDPLGGVAFSGWVKPADYAVLYLPAALNVRSFRITLNDLANPDGYVQASRLMMGEYWAPAANADYGSDFQWIDNSAQTRTGGNSLRSDGRAPFRQLSVNFSYLSPPDTAKLLRIIMRCGKRAEVFVAQYPEWGAADADYADMEYQRGFVGKLAGPNGSASRSYRLYGDRLVLQEI